MSVSACKLIKDVRIYFRPKVCTYILNDTLVFQVSQKPESDYRLRSFPWTPVRRLRARLFGFICSSTPGDTTMMTQVLGHTETDKQTEAYEFIKEQVHGGYAPSIGEIGRHIGERSRDVVAGYLQAMEDEGLITPGSFLERVVKPFGEHMKIRMAILTDPENGIQYMAVKHLN